MSVVWRVAEVEIMIDESSVLLRLISLGVKNIRKGMALNAVCSGCALVILYFVSLSEITYATVAGQYFLVAVVYAAASLIASAYVVVKQPFITPEVRYPKCNFCGGTMSTISLKCEACQSKSNKDDA